MKPFKRNKINKSKRCKSWSRPRSGYWSWNRSWFGFWSGAWFWSRSWSKSQRGTKNFLK